MVYRRCIELQYVIYPRLPSQNEREANSQTMIKALEDATNTRTTELSTLVGIVLLDQEETSSSLINKKAYTLIYLTPSNTDMIQCCTNREQKKRTGGVVVYSCCMILYTWCAHR